MELAILDAMRKQRNISDYSVDIIPESTLTIFVGYVIF